VAIELKIGERVKAVNLGPHQVPEVVQPGMMGTVFEYVPGKPGTFLVDLDTAELCELSEDEMEYA
jgi:hypothetical protein